MRSSGCPIDGTGSWAGATVGGKDWSLTITTQSGYARPTTGTLAGHPANVAENAGDGGHHSLQADIYLDDHVVDATGEGGYDVSQILTALDGYREVDPFDDPAAWTGGPLG